MCVRQKVTYLIYPPIIKSQLLSAIRQNYIAWRLKIKFHNRSFNVPLHWYNNFSPIIIISLLKIFFVDRINLKFSIFQIDIFDRGLLLIYLFASTSVTINKILNRVSSSLSTKGKELTILQHRTVPRKKVSTFLNKTRGKY